MSNDDDENDDDDDENDDDDDGDPTFMPFLKKNRFLLQKSIRTMWANKSPYTQNLHSNNEH